ncbi:Crossover junction endodeoxyribonuclease RuvA [Paraburkholderia unamae]|uniref:RusA family crossover junction endodeoxyribonuclease n=1 Tax=Paraburkholderia unamae TaxID=219649 RepID=UPI001CB15698|nr:RusA family crossover junction endodeoxyribonuclease [Paraburkholderia unamae]CAG9258494.1 Crossover junction endodeoxyribonuclease RuvA [Paraburkholderia unamae]
MSARVPVLLQSHTAGAAISLVIRGEPASKANSREIVTRRYRDEAGQVRTRPQSIKSDKARDYERAALLQIPAACRVRLTGPVRVTIRIFYATERPDLDESVVLDVLQDRYAKRDPKSKKPRELVQAGIYRNDRQVRERHVYHAIDRANPRAEIVVEPLTAQQCALDLTTAGGRA